MMEEPRIQILQIFSQIDLHASLTTQRKTAGCFEQVSISKSEVGLDIIYSLHLFFEKWSCHFIF